MVDNAEEVDVRFGEDGDPIDAKVAGTDPSTDLALLKIDPDKADGRACGWARPGMCASASR